MATQPGVNQGKAGFLEQILREDSRVGLDAVNRAWQAAGNEGTISESYLSKTRAKLGLTKPRGGSNGGGAPKRSQTKGAPKRLRAEQPPVAEESSRTSGNGTTDQPESAPPAKQVETENRDRVLEDLETDLDRLMFKIMGIGGMERVEQALRMARRVVTREIRA